ncbi:MAG: hypothetical protein LBS96_02495 [Oscillospiraceae bacterium]|jgi:predicted transposase/invertase (TIGR01784 family)|nr:hypothetical protein [Oscillospiraceae bacterium]
MELEMAANTSPVIREAYAYLAELSEDEKTRLRAEARLKAQRDEQSRLEGALEEGLEKGLEKGLQKGLEKGRSDRNVEIILNMHGIGLANSTIALATNLTEAQVEEILKAQQV